MLLGPGLAASNLPDDMKLAGRKLWRDSLLPVIVDASALDWLTLDPVPRNTIRIITPHPGGAAPVEMFRPRRCNRIARTRSAKSRNALAIAGSS